MSLSVDALHVRYGRIPILSGLDLRANAGALTAIVGPNGSGKSTLLKAICGDIAYQGQVRLNGNDIATLTPWQLASLRGVLPQASSLAFPFTAIEVVRIGLTSGPGAEQSGRALDALSRVGLHGHATRFYQELSGGEQQRVQLARVLAQIGAARGADGPRWLLLDEPVASLDIAHQLQVMQIARTFAKEGGGVLAVMHDLNLTGLFADQVVVMTEGRVLASGPPKTVMTDAVLSQAYGCQLQVSTIPSDTTPFFLPHAATLAAG